MTRVQVFDAGMVKFVIRSVSANVIMDIDPLNLL